MSLRASAGAAVPPFDRTPLIGIFPRNEERAKGNGLAYLVQACLARGVQEAGGAAVVLTPTDDAAQLACYVDAFDGFLIPGGSDIDPACYGEKPLDDSCESDPVRDRFERELIPLIIAADKPLLGICRGIQILNVVLGGTLWQDIPSQPESIPIPLKTPLQHHTHDKHDLLIHTVAVEPDTLLARVLGDDARPDLPVNSLHHQGVKQIAPGLIVDAVAPDGFIEGVELPDRNFVLAVQWHPEFLWESDAASMKLFRALVDAARA